MKTELSPETSFISRLGEFLLGPDDIVAEAVKDLGRAGLDLADQGGRRGPACR